MTGKRFHLIVIGFILVLLIIFVGLNYYVDPANLYHDSSSEIAQAISEGHAAYAYGDNANERGVKYELIQRMPKHVDCIAFGTSVIMGVTADDVSESAGGDGFYNLAVSSADYYDLMATLGMLDKAGVTYDRFILCIEPDLYDKEYYENATWSQDYREFAGYEIGQIKNRAGEGVDEVADPKPVENPVTLTELRQLFALTYAQRVVYEIRRDGGIFRSAGAGSSNGGEAAQSGARWGYADSGYPYGYFNKDASWVFSTDYDKRTLTDIINDCNNYSFDAYFTKGAHQDRESVETVEALIEQLTAEGVQVDLFVCPLAPTLYAREDMADYPILQETADYAKELADKYDLKLYGDLDPATYGFEDADFYDPRHLRSEHFTDIFGE